MKPLIIFCFPLALFLFSTAQGKVIESIAAIVNNEIITQSDIKKYRQRLRSGSMIDDLLIDPSQIKSLLKDEKAIVEVLINEKILASEVKKQNLEVTIERVEKEVRKISKRNGISRDQLVAALKAQGVNFSEYQNFIKTRIERQSLVEKSITSKIKISDEEISAHYISKNGRSAQQVRETTVAHIFVKKKSKNPSKPLEKIKLVEKKLKQGQNFETLASKYSEDENFSQGGLLGTFKTGELVGDMEKAINKLAEGQVSSIVETKRGFHILKVVKVNLIADPALEREKGRIRANLYQKAFKKQF